MRTHNGNELTTADLASASPQTREHDPVAPATPADVHDRDSVFTQDEVNQLRPKWDTIQTKFIDEPRKSVEEADVLVASTIKRLADSFANERAKLESQWAGGGDASTEDLRLALRRYRSFFDRLLST
jgi:hypothetical protein